MRQGAAPSAVRSQAMDLHGHQSDPAEPAWLPRRSARYCLAKGTADRRGEVGIPRLLRAARSRRNGTRHQCSGRHSGAPLVSHHRRWRGRFPNHEFGDPHCDCHDRDLQPALALASTWVAGAQNRVAVASGHRHPPAGDSDRELNTNKIPPAARRPLGMQFWVGGRLHRWRAGDGHVAKLDWPPY